MHKPIEPIRCPKCGTIVKVDLSKILTSNPPCYEWTCPNCGEKGNTKHGDVITFENQIGGGTSGYIQKVDEPDLCVVGVTTTNATGDGYNTINAVPSIYSPYTECEICGEEFKYDVKHMHICPKCRKTIVRLQKTTDGTTANAMPADKSTANTKPENKSTATDSKTTACNILAPQFIQQGWQCPKCGAILAPNQNYCPFCSKKESDWITTVGTGTQPFYAEWPNKDALIPPTGQYVDPNPSRSISDSTSVTYVGPTDNITIRA